MGGFGTAIIVLAVGILVPLILGACYRARVKEERKNKSDENGNAVTRMQKWQKILMLVLIPFMAAVLLALAIMAVVAKEYPAAICFGVINLLWSGSMLTLYFWVKLRYEIACDDKIITVRAFGKKRKELYYGKDIVYYGLLPGAYGSLNLYDKYGVPVLQISQLTVGVTAVVEKLQNAKVQAVMPQFPPPYARNTAHYKRYKSKKSYILGIVLGFVTGALFLIASFAMLLGNEAVPAYQNQEVTGGVEKVTYNYDTIEFKLVDDPAKYYVNNIVYEEVDLVALKSLFANNSTVVPEGDITLFVAYTDDYNRKNVSRIQFGGITILDETKAENVERINYRYTFYTNIGFWVVAGALIIVGIVTAVLYKVKFRDELPDEPPPQNMVAPPVNPFIRVVTLDPYAQNKPIDPFADDPAPPPVNPLDPFDLYPPAKQESTDPFGEEYSAPQEANSNDSSHAADGNSNGNADEPDPPDGEDK